MPRKQKNYHFIYKTTCIITNKYYIGMHSTNNLNDGYLGSGKRLRYSINKYGKENHKIEILEFLLTKKLLKEKEIKIINEELLNDPLCMNLKNGGEGGGFVNEAHKRKFHSAGGRKTFQILSKKHVERLKTDVEYKKRWCKSLSLSNTGEKNPFYGKKHTEESKQKIGNADRTGIKNSQYGTCWITNNIENKKIHKGDSIPSGWKLGRKIKI